MAATLEWIVDEAIACEKLRRSLRAGAMVYQYDLKVEVAQHYGLTWDQVDLPYAEWETLRTRYLEEK